MTLTATPLPNQAWINGSWVAASDNATSEQHNPANLDQITGVWPRCTTQDADRAVAAAKEAFSSWRQLTVYQRAAYLERALELMRERREVIARIITQENGKTLTESLGEIDAAIREMAYQIAEGLRTGGEVLPSSMPNTLAYTVRVPLGPVAVIAPWNFPFNVPARKITPALMAGNTCVLKPAELTPGTAAAFTQLYEEAQLPAGVLNLITGSGRVVGQRLVEHPDIKAVTFTGSTEVGMAIHAAAAPSLKRTQLEMGGKNPLVVLDDANLEEAIASARLAAFACAGQWCTSTSRVIVQASVAEAFVNGLLEKIQQIRVGGGTDPETHMGPVCGQVQMDGILTAIEKGKQEGATLRIGGNRLTDPPLGQGCFIEPTLFTEVTPDMSLAQEEIFGPVLSVMVANDLDHAIELANNVQFGLSSAIYTQSLDRALKFIEHTDVGVTHVNIPTAYKEPQFSFGGVKLSGHGIPEAGHTGIEFFTEHKVAYVRPAQPNPA